MAYGKKGFETIEIYFVKLVRLKWTYAIVL